MHHCRGNQLSRIHEGDQEDTGSLFDDDRPGEATRRSCGRCSA